MSTGLRTQRRRRPELPLVPLIDVLVMLVLFAFVTMRFSASRTLNITVPKVQTAGQNQFTGSIEIGIGKDGRVSLNGRVVAEPELEGALKEIQKINRNTTVLVRADEDSQFKKVTEVWDLCRQLGLNQVKMQARK
jgi:biopolymer transport protein ExbD